MRYTATYAYPQYEGRNEDGACIFSRREYKKEFEAENALWAKRIANGYVYILGRLLSLKNESRNVEIHIRK